MNAATDPRLVPLPIIGITPARAVGLWQRLAEKSANCDHFPTNGHSLRRRASRVLFDALGVIVALYEVEGDGCSDDEDLSGAEVLVCVTKLGELAHKGDEEGEVRCIGSYYDERFVDLIDYMANTWLTGDCLNGEPESMPSEAV